ncbi:GLPGLI family protein [Polaribacter aquimarinus]|uniref:GLPGLI family protein n=1 Tax=Polaribacter aquimarinus TaxID=2100726 RepID=A0A2U2JC81_9FLAO|nr:GLPGLI family protein [Polaribacter aquimarinus]PWG05956.1 hypothetical protein DIS07_05835 [Polaribacter aquimarinus]
MKIIIKFSIILLASLSIHAQTNSAIITYKKTKKKKTFTVDKKQKLGKEKLKRFAAIEKETDNISSYLKFSLYYNDNQASFKVNDFMETPNNRYIKLALLPYGKGEYYNNVKEKIKAVDIFGDFFLIHYPKDYTKWTLLDETKKIGNYKAYKAVAIEKIKTKNGFKTNNITAWYTPAINIQYGPIGYSGLPGLILELKKNHIVYYVTNIKLNPKKQVEVKKPTKGKKITYKEFNEMVLKATKKLKKIRGS